LFLEFDVQRVTWVDDAFDLFLFELHEFANIRTYFRAASDNLTRPINPLQTKLWLITNDE
jgi:hypothetical protein